MVIWVSGLYYRGGRRSRTSIGEVRGLGYWSGSSVRVDRAAVGRDRERVEKPRSVRQGKRRSSEIQAHSVAAEPEAE